jgi:hypothetical protein
MDWDTSFFKLAGTTRNARECGKGAHPNHIHVNEGIAAIPGYVRLDPPPAGT